MPAQGKFLAIVDKKTDIALSSTKSLMDLTKKILQNKIPQVIIPTVAEDKWWERLLAWASANHVRVFMALRGEALREKLLSLTELEINGRLGVGVGD